MPSGEKIEERATHRIKETKAMEADKNSPAGLFKGTFVTRRRLWRDEGDEGILRCPTCGHEHEGGPHCNVCGEQFADEGDDFSDYDEDDLHLDDVELDLDAESEVDAEFADLHGHHHFHAPPFPHMHRHHFQHPAVLDEAEDLTDSDGSEPFYDSEEDPGSLDGFVVQDEDEEPRGGRARARAANSQPVTIDLTSDDESDEGGAISNGRNRRRFQPQHSPPPAVPDALTISDDSSVRGSDYDETQSEANVNLYEAGWSPLNNGNESEVDAEASHPRLGYAYAEFTDDGEGDDESDSTNTSTLDGNHAHYNAQNQDEDEHESDSSLSETPTYRGAYARWQSPYARFARNYHNLSEDEDEDEETGSMAGLDRDGDTEMSASSRSSRSQSESLTPNARAREVSEPLTDYDGDRLTDDETFYQRHGLNPDGTFPNESFRDVSEPVTDYGADRITDDESAYGYGNATPHHEDNTSTALNHRQSASHFRPYSPHSFESPDYSRNSQGLRGVSEQPSYGDADVGDSDGYRIHTVHHNEPEEESSDASIRGPVRRRPRQPRSYSIPDRDAVRVHNHNPFDPISTTSRRERGDGAWYNPIMLDGASDDWDGATRSVGGPSSRNRRMTAYRNMPARRIDPLRSSRSPSVTRIISSSSRGSRIPRQYQRRG